MVAKREISRSWLKNVSQDKVFWCRDGRVIKNLEELAAAMREMAEETFHYHATGNKNDFSNWVRDVIGDVTLAKQLEKTTINTTAARRVEARLDWLKTSL